MLDIAQQIDLFSEGRVGALDRQRNAVEPHKMQVRRPKDMQDIAKMVELGAIMTAEGAYSNIAYDHDKVMKLGARILVDEDEDTFFGRLAERDGEPIGFMVAFVSEYFFSSQRIAQDIALYVHPDHRGGSAAIRLLREFMQWTKDKAVVEEQLGITEGVNNDVVAKMYEKLGYERAGYIYKRRTV